MNTANVAVKMLPCTNTKPSRFSVSIAGANRKEYSVHILPNDDMKFEDELLWIARKYAEDKGLEWFLQVGTKFKDSYVFPALPKDFEGIL